MWHVHSYEAIIFEVIVRGFMAAVGFIKDAEHKHVNSFVLFSFANHNSLTFLQFFLCFQEVHPFNLNYLNIKK